MPLALLTTPPPPSCFFVQPKEAEAAEAQAVKTKKRQAIPVGMATLRLPVIGQAARKPRLAGPPPPHVLAPYVGLRPVPPAPVRLAA